MKHLLLPLMVVPFVPAAAHAQVDILLSGSAPTVRATVGGIVLTGRLGARGLDVRVNERSATTSSSTRSRTRTSRTSTPASATAAAVLSTADAFVGTKYVWGGETPAGFDCSGFVQYVFRRHGVELPRTSRQQAQVGRAVATSLDALEPGDLMLFAQNGSRIDHIAIYVGNGEIIHSSASGGGVGYDRLSSKRGRWYVDHHVATRRVLADGHSLVGPLTAALRAFVGYDPPDRAPRR